ncbi:F-box protein At5g49610-like [Phoenix dactylifera]|uniref:F-box protein At5g49610-like n=1 Tax=Phoenix dactylifera TaxID=42345 RepID=A0A8B7BJ26_PHODC|nr:F-box protein At5g49610-like [Phoenix dactylifera]
MVRCVAKLTDDLMVEILSRLPTKSFFRFQCVSKSWLALSSDPYYQNNFPRAASGLFVNVPYGDMTVYRHRRRIQYISLSNSDDDLAIDTSLSFLRKLWNMEVISSSNGLLLCRSWVREIDSISPLIYGDFHAISLYVCNPATREWAVLPEEDDIYGYLALGFEPRLSHHYHVLRFGGDDDGIPRFRIFSTRTNQWVESEVSYGRTYNSLQATFTNGIFYVAYGLNQVWGIDPEGKVCHRIELPESDGMDCLGHSGGYLHYMLRSKGKIKVWMLKDYCHVDWIFKHCINVRAMLQKHGIPETPYVYVTEFHPDVDAIFLRIDDNIFSYHLNSGRLEEVYNLPDTSGLECVAYSPTNRRGLGDEVV